MALYSYSYSYAVVVSSPDQFSSPIRKYDLGTLGTVSWASLVQLPGIWAHHSDCELQVINSKHSLSGVETLKVWLDVYKGNANSNGEQLGLA